MLSSEENCLPKTQIPSNCLCLNTTSLFYSPFPNPVGRLNAPFYKMPFPFQIIHSLVASCPIVLYLRSIFGTPIVLVLLRIPPVHCRHSIPSPCTNNGVFRKCQSIVSNTRKYSLHSVRMNSTSRNTAVTAYMYCLRIRLVCAVLYLPRVVPVLVHVLWSKWSTDMSEVAVYSIAFFKKHSLTLLTSRIRRISRMVTEASEWLS